MKRPRSIVAAALVLASGAAVFACGDDRAPAAETRLLVLDGMTFTLDDVAPYVAFLDSFMPEGGRKTKIQKVLEEHLIPLRLAQRAFPAEREELRKRAADLRSVAGNIEELERHAAQLENKERFDITRLQAQLPAGMFLFDPLKVRSVSDPIELPQGFLIVSAYELHQSPVVVADYVDALEVPFVTHKRRQWRDWYEAQKSALAPTATFVHPDYRTAIPPWIQLPKLP